MTQITEFPIGTRSAGTAAISNIGSASDEIPTNTIVDEKLTQLSINADISSFGTESPSSGNATASGSTVVLDAKPVENAGRITNIIVHSASDGNAFLHVYRPEGLAGSGVVVNRISRTTIPVSTGINDIDISNLDVLVEQGDLIGLSGVGVLRRTSNTADFPYYMINDVESVNLNDQLTSSRFEFRVYIASASLLSDVVLDLKSRVDELESADAETYTNETKGFIVALLAGQSNIAGRHTAPSEYTIESGRGYKYNPTTQTIVDLVEPTGTDSTAMSSGGRTSLGSALAWSVLQETNGKIGVIVVNVAIGGTTISTWHPAGSNWNSAISKWNNCISDILAKKINVVGCVMIWGQGESDANSGTDPEIYKSGLESVRDQARTLTGINDLPVILVQTGVSTDKPNDADWAAIRNAQAELARNGNGFLMGYAATRWLGERGEMIDTLHYSSKAQDEIGRTIAPQLIAKGIGLRPSGLDT